jgi:hypothetical protein
MKLCDKLYIGLAQVDVIRAADDGVRHNDELEMHKDELEMHLHEGVMIGCIKFLMLISVSASL